MFISLAFLTFSSKARLRFQNTCTGTCQWTGPGALPHLPAGHLTVFALQRLAPAPHLPRCLLRQEPEHDGHVHTRLLEDLAVLQHAADATSACQSQGHPAPGPLPPGMTEPGAPPAAPSYLPFFPSCRRRRKHRGPARPGRGTPPPGSP